jgi:hypothetical protein
MVLRLDRPYFRLPADFSGKVQSMDLRCDEARIAHTPEPNAIAAAK